METESGHIGVVKTVSWDTPVVSIVMGDDTKFDLHENDVAHVMKEGIVWGITAVEITSGDKILNITPYQDLIKKSITGGLF